MPGLYQVTEDNPPPGYSFPPTVTSYVQYVYVFPSSFPGSPAVVTFLDHWLPGAIKIEKSANDWSFSPPSGAEFALYGGVAASGTAITTVTVQPDPTCTTEGSPCADATIDNLKPGIYTVAEVSAPPGYKNNSTPVTVTVCPSVAIGSPYQPNCPPGTPPPPVIVQFDAQTNCAPPGSITITKFGNDSPPLTTAGAVFSITALPPGQGGPPTSTPPPCDGYSYAPVPATVTVVCPTSAPCNGATASYPPNASDTYGLLPGNYLVTETTPPPNYETCPPPSGVDPEKAWPCPPSSQVVTVQERDPSQAEQQAPVAFNDWAIEGTVTVNKYDFSCHKVAVPGDTGGYAQEGDEFLLYGPAEGPDHPPLRGFITSDICFKPVPSNPPPENGCPDENVDSLIDYCSLATITFAPVVPGTYSLIENQAQTGYEINYPVTLTVPPGAGVVENAVPIASNDYTCAHDNPGQGNGNGNGNAGGNGNSGGNAGGNGVGEGGGNAGGNGGGVGQGGGNAGGNGNGNGNPHSVTAKTAGGSGNSSGTDNGNGGSPGNGGTDNGNGNGGQPGSGTTTTTVVTSTTTTVPGNGNGNGNGNGGESNGSPDREPGIACAYHNLGMLTIGKLGNDTQFLNVTGTNPAALFQVSFPYSVKGVSTTENFYIQVNAQGMSTCVPAPAGYPASGTITDITPDPFVPTCMQSPEPTNDTLSVDSDILSFLPVVDDTGAPVPYTVTELTAPPGYTPLTPITGDLCPSTYVAPPGWSLLAGAICPVNPTATDFAGTEFRMLTSLFPDDRATPGAIDLTLNGNDADQPTAGASYQVTRVGPPLPEPISGYTASPTTVTTSCASVNCETFAVTVSNLIPGYYLVHEVSPPTGYGDVLSDDELVVVNPGESTPADSAFANQVIDGDVVVHDYGNDSPFLPTGGATVTISGGPPGGIPATLPTTLTTSWDPLCGCATTDFTSLMPGTYTLTVDTPSIGYQNPTPVTQTVSVNYGATTIATLNESYVAGSLQVEKFGSQSEDNPPPSSVLPTDGLFTVLPSGASFSVTGPGGYSDSVTVTCSAPVPLGTPCTDGGLISGLKPGIYTVSESAPPPGGLYSDWPPGGVTQTVLVEPSVTTVVEFDDVMAGMPAPS